MKKEKNIFVRMLENDREFEAILKKTNKKNLKKSTN